MGMLLEVKNLSTHFDTEHGVVKAVDRVNLAIDEGDTLGVVGESGCGKTVLALSIMRLISSPPGKIVSGSILFNGADLLKLDMKRCEVQGQGYLHGLPRADDLT